MTTADILQIVYSFLGWVLTILNALNIHTFDDNISEAMENLL